MKRYVLFGVALWTLVAPVPAAPPPQDLHAYWDARCHSCHGDAGPFARRTLRTDRGLLVGYHHTEAPALQRFLKSHYLADDLIAPVTAMLTAQVNTPPLFAQYCASCHGNAATFARSSLIWRDGVLTGKQSGRAVELTLRNHGGLNAADAALVLQSLKRVMGEVGAK